MKKDVTVAYLLWLFLGLIGAHKFYLGKIGMGILYIFTGGLFLIGLFVDLFTIPKQVEKYNREHQQ
jgi:TM2 domain-containing membrane protein YozV